MSDAVDKAQLLESIDSDLAFLADALQVYNEDCPQLLSQMRSALTRQDNATLEDAAHTLKGLLSNLAAYPAVEAALKLEAMASCGELSGAENAIAVLENESLRVKVALEEMLRQD